MITAGTVVGWAALNARSLVSGKDRVRPNLQPAGLPEEIQMPPPSRPAMLSAIGLLPVTVIRGAVPSTGCI